MSSSSRNVMTSDAALLSLIVDDEFALSVLAAWGAVGPSLDRIDDDALHAELTDLVRGGQVSRVRTALKRLHAARVIVDGGITELADKLLQSIVQSKIGGKKR